MLFTALRPALWRAETPVIIHILKKTSRTAAMVLLSGGYKYHIRNVRKAVQFQLPPKALRQTDSGDTGVSRALRCYGCSNVHHHSPDTAVAVPNPDAVKIPLSLTALPIHLCCDADLHLPRR